jgi:hypothetical protein
MYNYTVTFKYDGEFDLPNDPEILEKKVPGMVLDKLEKHEFELIDFNLSANYDTSNASRYIEDPYLHRAVLEISLDLTKADLKTRESIYNRCLLAMQNGELTLCSTYENEDNREGMLQSIMMFV